MMNFTSYSSPYIDQHNETHRTCHTKKSDDDIQPEITWKRLHAVFEETEAGSAEWRDTVKYAVPKRIFYTSQTKNCIESGRSHQFHKNSENDHTSYEFVDPEAFRQAKNIHGNSFPKVG